MDLIDQFLEQAESNCNKNISQNNSTINDKMIEVLGDVKPSTINEIDPDNDESDPDLDYRNWFLSPLIRLTSDDKNWYSWSIGMKIINNEKDFNNLKSYLHNRYFINPDFYPQYYAITFYGTYPNGKITVHARRENTTRRCRVNARGSAKEKLRNEYGYGLVDDPLKGREPMLGSGFGNKSVKAEYPSVIQPKLDGVRGLVYLNYNNVRIRSRRKFEYKFLEDVKDQCRLLLSELPENSVIDGELYVHGVSYQHIESIVSRTVNRHPDEGKIEYWIFDLINWSEDGFISRFEKLRKAFNSIDNELTKIKLVDYDWVYCEDDVWNKWSEYSEYNFEGAMLRKPDKKYHFGRTNSLQKVKVFNYEDSIVNDVSCGSGNESGLALFHVFMPQYNEMFWVRPCGTHNMRAYWYKNPDKVIGRWYELKFQDRYDDGTPRFPIGYRFKDDL